MNYKRHLIILVLAVVLANFCKSQNIMFRKDILPKVKATLYTLYPNASNVHPDRSYVNDSIQLVGFRCNCKEDSGLIAITFDTNGNWLRKDFKITVKELPNYIVTYIKNNRLQDYCYSQDEMMEIINSKGDVSYSINIAPPPIEGPTCGFWYYVLKFKSSGEFISKEKRFANL
jgi:hypothetical protein